MDIESIKVSYRQMSIVKKLLIIIIIGAVPGSCTYIEEGPILQEDLDRAINTRNAARAKFQKAREQKANLPKLEEKLALKEGELSKASKKLPDEFVMGKILQKTAMIAQDVGVDLNLFQPGQGAPAGGVFKYVELPISLQIIGTYVQIATFFDRVVHLDLLVHIKNIELSLAKDIEKSISEKAAGSIKDKDLQREAIQRARRENAKIMGTADMVIFRTLSRREELAIEAASQAKSKKGKGKKKK
ncbi:MAG: type 4a pilus biogenesis protein PilO [Oligoflexales bacterium]|nr:type 4a pilus biogenesis protein PilO [Oligoflexales bacterium]